MLRRNNIVLLLLKIIIFLALQSCNKDKVASNIELKLDSVFVNQHLNKEIEGLPYVFFYYNFINNTKDTVVLDFKMFDLENSKDEAFCFCTNNPVELFVDRIEPYRVPPYSNQDIRFDISADFFTDNNNLKLDTLSFYASNCKNKFYINGEIIEDSNTNRKIVYRNKNDTLGTQIWK